MTERFKKLSEQLTSAFQKNFSDGLEVGAALALYHRGEKILSLHGGWCDAAKTKPWQSDTLALIWSAGKGIAALCLLHVLQEKKISLEEKVATFWPAFAQGGKEKITIAELLSHRAGLAALDQHGLALTDHEAIAQALAAQQPNWPLDGSHGYGARTFGILVDELLRRIADGEPLAAYWRRVFGNPLQLDLWFGIAASDLSRVAEVIPPKTTPPPSRFGTAYSDHASLTRRAFMEPGGNFSMGLMNQAAMRQASIISSGAISSAEALAKFYSLVVLQQENEFFTPATRHWMETPMTYGLDRVFMTETRFSAGLMVNIPPLMGASPRAFGHPGAGGAMAFADPEHELGFAYLPNAMHHGILTNARTQRIVDAFGWKIGERPENYFCFSKRNIE